VKATVSSITGSFDADTIDDDHVRPVGAVSVAVSVHALLHTIVGVGNRQAASYVS
jgi:hypothetical protein